MKNPVKSIANAITGGSSAPAKKAPRKRNRPTAAQRRAAATTEPGSRPTAEEERLDGAAPQNQLDATNRGDQDIGNPPAGDAGKATGESHVLQGPPLEEGVQAGLVNPGPAPETVETAEGVQFVRPAPVHGDVVFYVRNVNGEVRHYPAQVGGAPPRSGVPESAAGSLDLKILHRTFDQPVENAYDVPEGDGTQDKTWFRLDPEGDLRRAQEQASADAAK